VSPMANWKMNRISPQETVFVKVATKLSAHCALL